MRVGTMRALDARVGGKAYVAGGVASDVRGTHALARDLAGLRMGSRSARVRRAASRTSACWSV